MQTVGLKTLKNKLSVYIRAAAAGETVLVTDRDRVVAEIRPPCQPEGATREEISRADLIRRGILTLSLCPLKGPPPRVLEGSFDDMMRELDADRVDR